MNRRVVDLHLHDAMAQLARTERPWCLRCGHLVTSAAACQFLDGTKKWNVTAICHGVWSTVSVLAWPAGDRTMVMGWPAIVFAPFPFQYGQASESARRERRDRSRR